LPRAGQARQLGVLVLALADSATTVSLVAFVRDLDAFQLADVLVGELRRRDARAHEDGLLWSVR
jgi:hypothetical protein